MKPLYQIQLTLVALRAFDFGIGMSFDMSTQHSMTGEFLGTQMARQVFLFGKMKLQQMFSQSLRMFVAFRTELALVVVGQIVLVYSLYVYFDVTDVKRLSALRANHLLFLLSLAAHLGTQTNGPLGRIEFSVGVFVQHLPGFEAMLTVLASQRLKRHVEVIVEDVPLEFLAV